MTKPRPELLPPKAILAAAEVMALNEGKHPNAPWKTNYSTEDHVGALLRHCLKWLGGEKVDPETGKSHLIHAACRSLMASEVEMREKETQQLVDALDRASYWRDVSDGKPNAYTHLEEAPPPEPADPQYDSWLEYMDGKLTTNDMISENYGADVVLDGWGSRIVQPKAANNGKPIDEYTPEDWDRAARESHTIWKKIPPPRYFPPTVAFDSGTRRVKPSQTWPEGRI